MSATRRGFAQNVKLRIRGGEGRLQGAMTTTAKPCKLRSGVWGAKVQSTHVSEGDTITITTRAGKSWDARVARIVWRGDGVSICVTESLDRPKSRNWDPDAYNGRGAPRGGYRKACVSDGNCSSFGSGRSCGGYDCDGY